MRTLVVSSGCQHISKKSDAENCKYGTTDPTSKMASKIVVRMGRELVWENRVLEKWSDARVKCMKMYAVLLE